MSRYFYKDPLAAAWMAKHHGMRFTMRAGASINFDVDCESVVWDIDADQSYFFIHPDSLSALEPRVADIVRFGEDHYGVFKEPDPEYRPNFSGIPIIQRNGIAFMWPESEAT